jgi:epoxide hydrolase-like predicted phosphatase
MSKVLVFDLGNTVLTNDWHHDRPEKDIAFCEYFNVSKEVLESSFDSVWLDFSLGKISEEHFWEIFLEKSGTKKPNVKKAKALWRKYQKPIDGMLDLLSMLKKNYRMAAITNISKEWLAFKRKKFKLDAYFETIVSSAGTGIKKPDPKIYQILIKRLKVKPENCIFIDDSKKVFEGVQKQGLNIILFKDRMRLEEDLKKEGIIIKK